jgi:putative tryptophan/tyrosine transport system substrate-binding protein
MLNSRHSRRSVLAGVARTVTLLALLNAAKGKGAQKTKRLAMVRQTEMAANLTRTAAPRFRAFFDELTRLGHVEDQNLVVLRFAGDEGSGKYPTLAQELVKAAPDVIFIAGGDMVQALKPLVSAIPIVAISNDPIARGLVTNLARPDGNITGVSVDAGLEIWGKRVIVGNSIRLASEVESGDALG